MICCPSSPSPASVKVPFREENMENKTFLNYFMENKLKNDAKMITSCSIRRVGLIPVFWQQFTASFSDMHFSMLIHSCGSPRSSILEYFYIIVSSLVRASVLHSIFAKFGIGFFLLFFDTFSVRALNLQHLQI